MAQQVNLLNKLPRPSKYYLTERLVIQILGGFILLLVLITLVQIMLLLSAKHHSKSLEKSYMASQQSLAKISHLAGNVSNEKLSQEIKSKTDLLQVLQARKITSGECTLLSRYFTSLAQTPVSGIWFDQININLINDGIALTGRTHSPTLLMQLVQSLDKMPCFVSREFASVKVGKVGNEVGRAPDKLFNFTVNSKSGLLSPIVVKPS